MQSDYNEIPDIETYNTQFDNPTLRSPNSVYELPFYQTRDTLLDIETYRNFLKNAMSRFRKSATYKHYKGFLLNLGLDRCQFHGNITADMASIEMHHNCLNLMDLALIITEHTLNTTGKISSFDLVQMLKEEHKAHRIQLVMLSLTPHQLFHSDPEFFIHPSMCFGDWYSFLEKYKYGITQDIAFKILFYLKKSLETSTSCDNNLLALRDNIKDWGEMNGW